MESDWKSVIRKLEKGNFIRDKLSRLDLRVCHYGKSSPEFLVGNARKGSRSGLVGSGGKATTKRYILEYDFSSVGLVLLLAILTIVLLILLYFLVSVVDKVDLGVRGQLQSADRQSMSTVFDRFGNSSIRPVSITITQKIKCTAESLLRPKGIGECT